MKKILFIIVIMLSVSLFGCVHVEDTNGPDDFSITSYSEEEMLNGRGSHVDLMYVKSVFNNAYNYSSSKFSGIKTLERINISQESTLVVTTNVEKGNFRFIILKNNELFIEPKINFTETFELLNGSYTFIIVGESAKYKISMEIE